VAEVADKAKAALPESHGRIDSATKIVLAGDVELLPEGKAKVASQSTGTTTYRVVNGQCDCKDAPKAPEGWCKHRLSAAIARRATTRCRQILEVQLDGATPTPQPTLVETPAAPLPLPEAPVSITLKGLVHGREVLVTLRGTDFASVKVQVDAASQWLQARGGQPATDTPHCRTHGVPLVLQHGKDGRTWYSHKTADGWCKGR
jgi:hypothetical protein